MTETRMSSKLTVIQGLMRQALVCEDRGNWADACDIYARVITEAPRWPVGYLCLGSALGQQERFDEAAQVISIGHDRNPTLLELWRQSDTEQAVAVRSRYADGLLRSVLTRKHQRSVLDYEQATGCGPLNRVRSAIWCQTHDQPFHYEDPRQRPWLLYLPGVDAQPWFETEEIPWAADFLSRHRAIEEEVLAAVDALAADIGPYVPAQTPVTADMESVRGAMAWSSIDLFREGVPAADHVLAAFPQTLAALDRADCVRLEGRPMAGVVSILAPGASIPPHCGLANTRITVHLPIVVPPGCTLTVAGESRYPRAGELTAFDDAFEHEARNPAERPRIHLIFEAWRPDLREHEKGALTRCIEDRGRWNRNRRLPEPGQAL